MKVFHPVGVNIIERMKDIDPSRLIQECIAGNETAIETFVRGHEADVFKLALSIVRDESEAMEITQETFIAALKSLHSFKEIGSLKTWLFKITLNRSRSHLRKRNFLQRLSTTLSTLFKEAEERQTSPEENVIQNEREAVIWSELNKLDERQRIVVILRYFQDLPIVEIAEILNLYEGTVHSRLHTARERLRIALGQIQGK